MFFSIFDYEIENSHPSEEAG